MQIEFVAGTAASCCDEEELNSLLDVLQSDVPEFEFDSTYLSFVRTCFGGRPVRNKYVGLNGPVWIDRFLNFQHPPRDDFSNVNAVWNAIEDRLSPGVFPIADNGMGDYFCLDHSASPAPVVLWYHELSEKGRPYLQTVAPSFDAFLAGLEAGT